MSHLDTRSLKAVPTKWWPLSSPILIGPHVYQQVAQALRGLANLKSILEHYHALTRRLHALDRGILSVSAVVDAQPSVGTVQQSGLISIAVNIIQQDRLRE